MDDTTPEWKTFFHSEGETEVKGHNASDWGGSSRFTVEELYQAFKARFLAEQAGKEGA